MEEIFKLRKRLSFLTGQKNLPPAAKVITTKHRATREKIKVLFAEIELIS